LAGPGFGLYGAYVNGGFSADATGKLDFLSLNENFSGGLLVNTISTDITNAGVSGNVQYKYFLAARSFFEPTAGASYTRTMFNSGAGSLGLKDGSTVRVQGGARIGIAWEAGTTTVEATLKGLVYSNVLAEGTSLNSGAVPFVVAPTDQGLVRGEIDPALTFDFHNGYSAFFDGSIRFGEEIVGGSVKGGLRKQW
jgi:hypothetical protein